MKIQLTSTQSRFTVGEYFEVHLRLVNDGDSPIEAPDPFNMENPQPTYSVQGPSHADTKVVSALGATMPGHKRAPADAPVATITLAPGEVLEGDLPLSVWLGLRQAGTHELVAAIAYEGQVAVSTKLVLDIDALQPQGVSVGVDEGVPAACGMTASFIQIAGAQHSIYDVVFAEDSPELGEIVVQEMSHRRDLDLPAESVHVPWCNRDRTEGLSSWRFWVTSQVGVSQLRVEDSPLSEPVDTALAQDARLLLPAVADADETLDVPLLVDGGQVVEIARFRGGTAPSPPQGSLPWRSAATSRVHNAGLALGSPASGNLRRLVTLEERDGTATVSHYWVDGPDTPTASQPVRGGQFLPGAPMAVRVTSDGITRCRLLLYTHGRAWRVYMASLDFDEHGRLMGHGAIATLISRQAPMPCAAIEFPAHDRDATDVAWALADHDGNFIWGRGAGGPLQGRIAVPLAIPLQLRPLAFATYLCVTPPGRAPDLVALGGRDVRA